MKRLAAPHAYAFSLSLALALLPAAALAREPLFVSPGQFNATRLLPAPPEAGSPITQGELQQLHTIESQRTAFEETQARSDEADRTIFLFRDLFGPLFNAQNLPLTARLSSHVTQDEIASTETAKEGFRRIRPYNNDKTLRPACKTKTKDDAYPSGHATSGYLMALTLIDLVPEKRDAILARAETYARNRLVCGVHHPSDIEAGKLLAYALYPLMAASPRYQEEMQAARAELRQTLGLDLPAATSAATNTSKDNTPKE